MKRPTRVPVSMMREDEERLEHDGEVIPEADEGASGAAERNPPAKMWAMPRASEGAPPVRAKSVCSPASRARAGHFRRR